MLARTALGLVALGCTGGSAPADAQSPVTVLGVSGRANANPSLAAQGTFVAIVWSGATTSAMDIYAATSTDGGRVFSAPVQVNAVAGEARVSGEEPPRVALVARAGKPPEIVVVWTAKAGPVWRLLSARSTDGGRTFSAALTVPGSEGAGSRGWQSVAVDPSGHAKVLWLDHRDLATAESSSRASGNAGSSADPTERAGLSQLMFASLDGKSAMSVTRSVCYCCKTGLATAGSNVYAVWRHVYPGSIRDIAFTVSRDGGRTFAAPVRVSTDGWKLDGCPDNGPAIALDRTQGVHVVWPTSRDGVNAGALAIFYAQTRDGRTFSPRLQIPTRGPASHPQVVVGTDGVPIIAWDEIVDGTRRVGMARVIRNAAGATGFRTVQAGDAGPGQWYPTLAVSSAGTVAAWVRQADGASSIGVARVP